MMGEGLTIESQQTRTSYRCPGFRFSRKNHESEPWDAAVVGNEALSLVRTTEFWGESLSTPRSSRDGSLEGMVDAGGARKMVFSTFACTEIIGSSSPSSDRGLICMVLLHLGDVMFPA